jgi:hypothetical protein
LSSNPDVKSITQRFFAAHDAHDVDGMLALCADGAQGRYLPYGKNSVMPVRGGRKKLARLSEGRTGSSASCPSVVAE